MYIMDVSDELVKRNRLVVRLMVMIIMVLVVFELDVNDFFNEDLIWRIINNEFVNEFEVLIEREI